MIHASLFSGIDGFGLASSWMGWKTMFTCEIDDFCNIILKHYYSNSIHYGDIKSTDFTVWQGRVDILTGGFPCQPYSVAGKRMGKNDERHLWPEMLRVIREVSPRWVVGENVRGITNWNGGLVFDEVQSDLEDLGYEVLPFLLPSAGVNAPHERYRTFFIAHSNGHDAGRRGYGETGCEAGKSQEQQKERKRFRGIFERIGGEGFIADADRERLSNRDAFIRKVQDIEKRVQNDGEVSGLCGIKYATDTNQLNGNNSRLCSSKVSQFETSGLFTVPDWRDFPTQSPVCNGNDGFPTELLRRRIRNDSMGLLSEKEIDKIISKAVTKVRTEAIKAGGNAVVAPLVFQIYKAIQEYENLTNR